MANTTALNVFSCDAGSFSIPDAIAGQTPLVMYDSLKQAALIPDLRSNANGMASVIMPYATKTPEALFSQMQAAWGAEGRTVEANEFFWTEYDAYDTLTFVVDKSVAAVPAAGAPVTVNINTLSKSATGNYVKPIATYYAWVKENNRQQVIIDTVATNGTTVRLSPINNEVLNLTQYNRYTIIIDPLRRYVRGTLTDIPTEGLVLNPPTMYKSFVQKYEKAFAVNQDEIDNYIYDRDFKILKGLNTRGESVEYFYIPALNGQLEAFISDNKCLNTLFGVRDNVNQVGFDGMVPTVEKYGMFNSGYDIFTNVSLKQILFGMIKTLRRIEGCNEYMLCNDFNFWMDWSESIADLIKSAGQSVVYELFGSGGTGSRDFSYYDFKNWTSFGYKFTPYMLDAWDARRYANPIEYFALMMPLAKFRDQFGATVPWITFVHIKGAEPAKVDNIWIDDARKRLARNLRVACQTSWGIEIHRPTAAGIMKRTPTN